MAEEVGGVEIDSREMREQRLGQELKSLTEKQYFIGHRGMNDPNNPDEMRRRSEAEAQVEADRGKAQGIVFQLTALGKGIRESDISNYQNLGLVKSTNALDIVKARGFHPNDIITDTIGYESHSGGRLRRVPEWKTVYRPKDIEPISDPERLWKSGLKWESVAKEFSRRPEEIINPIDYLREIIRYNRSQKIDTTKYEDAFREIEGILGIQLDLPVADAVKRSAVPVEPRPSVAVEQRLPESAGNHDAEATGKYPQDIWDNKNLSWQRISGEFGKMPILVKDPIARMEDIMKGQEEMGRDTSRFKLAIEEIRNLGKEKSNE